MTSLNNNHCRYLIKKKKKLSEVEPDVVVSLDMNTLSILKVFKLKKNGCGKSIYLDEYYKYILLSK